ncbi:MAG TPA: hypothetical protein VGH15_10955, partial [Caulobacteraceae bacterium]
MTTITRRVVRLVARAFRAASEGFRLIGRAPSAVCAWAFLWFAAFSISAWAVAASRHGIAIHSNPDYTLSGVGRQFGPFAVPLILLFFVVWLVTNLAAFRAVLHPGERRWFYLRLGTDEARLGVLTIAAFLALILIGFAPAKMVFLLASPIMRVVPTATLLVATAGVLITVWVEVWLGVRLSLIAVETFSEQRFHLSAYWPVTGGRFWFLLISYFLVFLILLVPFFVYFVALEALSATALAYFGNGDLLRRGSVLAIAGVIAALTAGFWTLSWTVICACQAYAFRYIV